VVKVESLNVRGMMHNGGLAMSVASPTSVLRLQCRTSVLSTW
jgi:hypothetical protein